MVGMMLLMLLLLLRTGNVLHGDGCLQRGNAGAAQIAQTISFHPHHHYNHHHIELPHHPRQVMASLRCYKILFLKRSEKIVLGNMQQNLV